jgi:AbrB family looped-hinge helix DNA binding protein
VHPRTVSPKGTIALPAALRKKYGLVPGSIVDVEDREGEIVVTVRLAYKEACGMLAGGPSLTEDLFAERAREREREERRIQGTR